MNIDIKEKNNKLVVEVSLPVYNNRKRNPKIVRESCDWKKVENHLLKNGYIGYIPHENTSKKVIDNKFTSLKGVFTFIKEEKREPHENNDTLQDIPENDLLIDENKLDNQEDTVLEYPKKKRRRRRKSYNTDE
tara:strand:+ start:246 stop:644 length:399 start_codon:yes stop_codon:yes gene_type:complete